jgi:hypothetical protein
MLRSYANIFPTLISKPSFPSAAMLSVPRSVRLLSQRSEQQGFMAITREAIVRRDSKRLPFESSLRAKTRTALPWGRHRFSGCGGVLLFKQVGARRAEAVAAAVGRGVGNRIVAGGMVLTGCRPAGC